MSVSRRARLGTLGMSLILGALTLRAQSQAPVVVSAQPNTPPLTSTGTAAITGTVVDATNGRPMAGAIVKLEERRSGLTVRSSLQATTPKGRFAFVDLSASESYFLTASKLGYLDGGYGRPDPRGPSAPIALTDGQWLSDVRVTMLPPGSLSGAVMDERGEPIVGAYVRVLSQVLIAGQTQWLAGAVTRTDDRGAYRIPGLGPGRYVVCVPSVQATLPASATVKPPGASAGTAMADLTASLDTGRAERLVVDVGRGQQLVVGRYTVSPPPLPDGQRTAYPVTFYPSSATPSDASPIDLRLSEQRSGIDFQLQPVPTARVSGVVQGPPDAVGNLQLRLIPLGLEELGQGSEAATTVTMADGRFSFVDVPYGSYLLDLRHALLELTYTSMDEVPTALPAPVPFSARSASSSSIKAAPPGVEYSSLKDGADVTYWGQLRVDVSGRNIEDLALPMRRPATLSGRFVWAAGVEPSTSRPPSPALEPADGRRSLGMPSVPGGPRDNSSTFTIDGVMPGQYFLRLRFGTAKAEAITWEGQDYSDRPFDMTTGRDVAGVVITLTSKSSAISGTVSDGGTALTSPAAVIAFPTEPEQWSNYGFNPTRLASVLTTQAGQYRIEGLPLGEYYVLAVPVAEERAWLDPAFLAGHVARASRIRIDSSDTTIAGSTLSLVK